MIATRHLAAFLLTVYVLILIPGPSVVFTVSRGIALGRRAALATVLGNTGGLALQLVIVAVGLGRLLAASQTVLTAMQYAGAAYLVYLGVRSIRHRHRLSVAVETGATQPQTTRRTVREGFVVGVTNPKGLILFTAVLPNFIERGAGQVTLQLATLGAICVLVGLLSDSSWALAAGSARRWFGRSQRRLEALTVGGGLAMIGLGAGLALTGHRNRAGAPPRRAGRPARRRTAPDARWAAAP
jgi:threonine/homoserine/homoserine lactone efflux protein